MHINEVFLEEFLILYPFYLYQLYTINYDFSFFGDWQLYINY